MITAAVVALVVSTQAPTIEMTITSGANEVGKAWLTQKLEGGVKKTYAKLILGDIRIVETAEYSMDGTPRLKVMTRTEGSKEQRIEARFGAAGVSVTGVASQIPFPTKGSLQAKSEFWFLQTKPPVGHNIEYNRFDIGTGAFVPCKMTFAGREEITFAGKKVMANKVQVDGKTDAWLDERGDPYRMVISGGTRFERVPN